MILRRTEILSWSNQFLVVSGLLPVSKLSQVIKFLLKSSCKRNYQPFELFIAIESQIISNRKKKTKNKEDLIAISYIEEKVNIDESTCLRFLSQRISDLATAIHLTVSYLFSDYCGFGHKSPFLDLCGVNAVIFSYLV